MILLLVAGIAVIMAGLAAIGFGIPVKEFGFGNTLILTGTIGVCTGLLLLGLAQVLRELRIVTRRADVPDQPRVLRAKRETPLDSDDVETVEDPASAEEGPLFSRDQRSAERAGSDQSSAPPWQEDALRDRARGGDGPAAQPDDIPAETKPRRNLLFSSSSRKERERAAAAQASDPVPELGPPPPERPRPVASPVVPPAGPRTFDDAWPQSDRPRPDAQRPARTPSTFSQAAAVSDVADKPDRMTRPEEAAPVTVLKSGVVDGMAYSLYSDGSIEAQMPEGMMRFASIDELREHLDHRG